MKALLNKNKQLAIQDFFYFRLILIIFNDLIILNSTLHLSYFIRLEYFLPFKSIITVFIFSNIIYLFIFIILKIYNQYFRFFDIKSYRLYLKFFLIFSIFFALFVLFQVNNTFIPRSLIIIFPVFLFFAIFINRIVISKLFRYLSKINENTSIVFGFDPNYSHLLFSHSKVMLFVDDKISKNRREYNGVKIKSIKFFHKNFLNIKFNNIYIINQKTFKNSRNLIREFIIRNQILVQNIEFTKQNIKFSPYFDFNFFFNRKPKVIHLPNIYDTKTILITGAGGSIGSGIIKQILKYNFKKLILIDNSEYNLYKLNQEISKFIKSKNIISHLIGFEESSSMTKIFKNDNIDIVFHAAAYKHVPLIEINPFSAIKNNFLNTFNFIKLCKKHNLPYFCLISSDKAVRPSNYMGASKRLAEIGSIYLNNFMNKNTIINCVRFGNVINSSGSVLPLFYKQINSGEPVTITHKNIIRYFMTIEEAANLVISVYKISKGGEIFLLDMGEPIKLYDLAKLIIQFSGKKIDSDNSTDIKIIGLRRGEKLYEELLVDNKSKSTKINNIYQSIENNLSKKDFEKIYKDVLNSYNLNNLTKLNSILKSKFINYKND